MPDVSPLLLAAPWLFPFLSLFRLAKKTPSLRDAAPASQRSVSVIVPARNEAAAIETLLTSLSATTYPRLEVIVVDDRSSDGTAAIVQRLMTADLRLRLVRGGDLPEGWYGKPWACRQGYEAAGGEVLVFTDADTRHAPELLAHAVGALESTGADLVTVAPRQRCLTFWERLIMPQVWILLAIRYHPAQVNRATRARDVIANGQFVMVRRAAYEAVGTHESVRGEVAEDLALAQRFWGAGKKIHFAFAEDLMETRMYTGLRHLIEGWSKNIYLGGRRSFPEEPIQRALVPVTLTAGMLFWLLPPLLVGLGLVGVVPRLLLAPALLATGGSLLYWCLIAFGMEIPLWYSLGYPLGALLTFYIIARSTLRGRGRVEWKGRTYGAAINRG
jgi:chlorobactene glucosyltransferase